MLERIINNLYDLLEGLIRVRYDKKNEKLKNLQTINTQLDILRYQTRLIYDFRLISLERYEYVNKQINSIGVDLGGWIKQQRGNVE